MNSEINFSAVIRSVFIFCRIFYTWKLFNRIFSLEMYTLYLFTLSFHKHKKVWGFHRLGSVIRFPVLASRFWPLFVEYHYIRKRTYTCNPFCEKSKSASLCIILLPKEQTSLFAFNIIALVFVCVPVFYILNIEIQTTKRQETLCVWVGVGVVFQLYTYVYLYIANNFTYCQHFWKHFFVYIYNTTHIQYTYSIYFY